MGDAREHRWWTSNPVVQADIQTYLLVNNRTEGNAPITIQVLVKELRQTQ